MNDITNLIAKHRLAITQIWNECFWDSTEDCWDLRDEFEKVSSILFDVMVLGELNEQSFHLEPSYIHPNSCIHCIKILPLDISSIMLNREVRSGYWDETVPSSTDYQLDLRFVNYFDWWELGKRNFELVEVAVGPKSIAKNAIGRRALVPFDTIKFLHTPVI